MLFTEMGVHKCKISNYKALILKLFIQFLVLLPAFACRHACSFLLLESPAPPEVSFVEITRCRMKNSNRISAYSQILGPTRPKSTYICAR